MELVFLFAALVLGSVVLETGQSDDEDDTGDGARDPDTPEDPVAPNEPITPVDPETPTDSDDEAPILVGGIGVVTGTAGDDLFALAADLVQSQTTSILGNDGNDTIDLFDETDPSPDALFEQSLGGLSIEGGAGDDLIAASTEGGAISGGEGNDTLLSYAGPSSTISGGDGDDFIGGIQANSDAVTINGDAGNDTINAAQMENAAIDGGPGADEIRVAGLGSSGAGYVLVATGGEDDDTISYDARANIYDDFQAQPHRIAGGEGADTFALRLSEGDRVIFSPTPATDDSLRLEALEVLDFQSGIDVIEIDATPVSTGFALTTAALSQITGSSGGTETELVLSYESVGQSEATREIIVSFGETTLSWDDIRFEGAQPTLLQAAAG